MNFFSLYFPESRAELNNSNKKKEEEKKKQKKENEGISISLLCRFVFKFSFSVDVRVTVLEAELYPFSLTVWCRDRVSLFMYACIQTYKQTKKEVAALSCLSTDH